MAQFTLSYTQQYTHYKDLYSGLFRRLFPLIFFQKIDCNIYNRIDYILLKLTTATNAAANNNWLVPTRQGSVIQKDINLT
jgi:hypothetical protein